MKLRQKLVALVLTAGFAMPSMAGNIYLTGHDVLLHGGQNGYWQVILDYLRNAGKGNEIPEADYDIAFLNSSSSFSFPGYTGTVTPYDPTVLDDAGWAEVFSKDAIVVPWAFDFSTAARVAFNARAADLAAFFDAGGDLWMNSSAGATDYYTVLPASLLSTGDSISGSTGFTATADGVAIGILNNMINGFATHNNFTTVASGLTVYEVRDAETISIGAQDSTIGGLGGAVERVPVPVPAISAWGLLLLIISISGLTFRAIRHN
jgi:hypothetical protein